MKIETSLVIKCVLVLIVKLKYSNLWYSTFSFPFNHFPTPRVFQSSTAERMIWSAFSLIDSGSFTRGYFPFIAF